MVFVNQNVSGKVPFFYKDHDAGWCCLFKRGGSKTAGSGLTKLCSSGKSVRTLSNNNNNNNNNFTKKDSMRYTNYKKMFGVFEWVGEEGGSFFVLVVHTKIKMCNLQRVCNKLIIILIIIILDKVLTDFPEEHSFVNPLPAVLLPPLLNKQYHPGSWSL